MTRIKKITVRGFQVSLRKVYWSGLKMSRKMWYSAGHLLKSIAFCYAAGAAFVFYAAGNSFVHHKVS